MRARSAAALQAVAQATQSAGGTIERAPAPASDPAGGQALLMRDSDGRRFEVVHGDTRRTPDTPPPKDQPQRLAHAVLNAHAVGSTQAFLEQALGFVLADRTRIMAFMNCDADHHTLALGDTDNDALQPIPVSDESRKSVVVRLLAEVARERVDDVFHTLIIASL